MYVRNAACFCMRGKRSVACYVANVNKRRVVCGTRHRQACTAACMAGTCNVCLSGNPTPSQPNLSPTNCHVQIKSRMGRDRQVGVKGRGESEKMRRRSCVKAGSAPPKT